MKKFLCFLIILMLFSAPNRALAVSSKDFNAQYGANLIYDLEKVIIDKDGLTFKAYAYVDKMNTFGGKNYDVSFIAIKSSDLSTVYENGSTSGLTRLISSPLHGYDGMNSMYPLFCFKTGDVCNRMPNNNDCYSGTTGSCIHYDPRFIINFSKDALYAKFGSAKIIFLIKISYAEDTGHNFANKFTYNSSNSYKATCTAGTGRCNVAKTKNIYRVIAASEGVTRSGAEEIGELNFQPGFGTKFVNTVQTGLIATKIDAGRVINSISGTSYFEFDESRGNSFDIVNERVESVMIKNYGTGIATASVNYYKIKINANPYSVAGRTGVYYNNNTSGATREVYIPSGWGTVNGTFSVQLIKYEPDPAMENEIISFNQNCNGGKYTNDKTKLFEKVYDSNAVANKLNDSACVNGRKDKNGNTISAYAKESRLYDFYEEEELNMVNSSGINVVTGNSWQDSDPKIYDPIHKTNIKPINTSPGMRFNTPTEFVFKRTLKWKAHDSSTYYYAKRWYPEDLDADDPSDTCVSEEGGVPASYLTNKGITVLGNSGFDQEVIKWLNDNMGNKRKDPERSRSGDNTEFNSGQLGVSYPDSNDFGEHGNRKTYNRPIFKNKSEPDNTCSSSGCNNTNVNYCRKLGDFIDKGTDSNGFKSYECEVVYLIENAYVTKNSSGYVYYKNSNYRAKALCEGSSSCMRKADEKYKMPSATEELIDLGNYYVLPYNFPTYDLNGADYGSCYQFRTAIYNVNVLDSDESSKETQALRSICTVCAPPGNIETMNYRVIDLKYPFPYYSGTSQIPKNWKSKWENGSWFSAYSNKDILDKRVNNASAEKYIINLSVNNMNKIRNDTPDNYNYSTAELNKKGVQAGFSKYINENLSIFTRKYVTDVTKEGESAS